MLMDFEQEIVDVPVAIRHPGQAFYLVVDSL